MAWTNSLPSLKRGIYVCLKVGLYGTALLHMTLMRRHKLFCVNRTYNLLTILEYDKKNVVGFCKQDLKPYNSRSHR